MYWRNQQIEDTAKRTLRDYENLIGRSVSLPVPIELIAERVLNLSILWEPIEEYPGETILGAIQPDKKLIVINENRKALFQQKPGLERSTIGHEMGHWELFFKKRQKGPSLFVDSDSEQSFSYRSSNLGQVEVMEILMQSAEGREIAAQIAKRADTSEEARVVNRYAAALLLPRELLLAELSKINKTLWYDLYRLAERCEVTISCLTVRLQQLKQICINEKKIFGCEDEMKGQAALNLN